MPTSVARSLVVALMLGTPSAMMAQKTPAATMPATPAGAVQEFMRALADSNLTRMAELFGNASGPVSKTKPSGYEKKIILMQLFLHGVQARTLGDVPGTKNGSRTVTTQLVSQGGCKVTIPINAMRTKNGWLVNQFDLDQAAQVNRPCDASGRPGGN